jgi:glutathione S-transferase
MGMLALYDYAASANCYKVRLALAQLGLPYERIPIDIFGGDTLTEEFAALNPMRRTPVLRTRDGDALPESGAILLHLAEGTSLMPSDARERAQALRWMFFEQGFFEPRAGSARFWRLTGRAEARPEAFEGLVAGAHEVVDVLDRHLDGRDWIVGERYSVADIALFGYAHVAHEAGIDTSSRSHMLAWCDRVRATPRFVDDLDPYPENARAGAGRSVHG